MLHITRGKVDRSYEDMVLEDGTIIKCLKSEEGYKFLGVPENNLHRVDNIMDRLKKLVSQRASVIWSSPLSDYYKVLSTNLFVHPPVQYFMWTEKLLLTDLRYLDNTIRQIMNENRAKYKLQLNEILYLPRSKGGRGLKCFETTYKEIKIKTAMKLITETEPRMKLVLDFDKKRMERNRSSILRDAIDFTENDFKAKLEIADHNFIFNYKLLNEWKSTSDQKEAVNIIKQRCVENGVENVINASWQGVNFKT